MLALIDVVIYIDEDDEIRFLRQARVARLGGDRLKIFQSLTPGAFVEIFHHVRLSVHAVHAALRCHVREAHREIAGARTDIRNHGVGFELQRFDDFVRLLPGVALRIVESLGPFLRIIETVLTGVV